MTQKQWLKASKAAKLLDVCSRTLHRMRNRGELKKGKHWKPINPSAIRLTYLYNVPAIDKLQKEVITDIEYEPPAEVVGVQPPLIDGVESFGITAAGEAVPVKKSPRRTPSGKHPHQSNVGKPSNEAQDCDPSSWPQNQD